MRKLTFEDYKKVTPKYPGQTVITKKPTGTITVHRHDRLDGNGNPIYDIAVTDKKSGKTLTGKTTGTTTSAINSLIGKFDTKAKKNTKARKRR